MYGLDLARLQDVAHEECEDEEDDKDEERPGCEDFFLTSLGLCVEIVVSVV